jgi:hypothetical protein
LIIMFSPSFVFTALCLPPLCFPLGVFPSALTYFLPPYFPLSLSLYLSRSDSPPVFFLSSLVFPLCLFPSVSPPMSFPLLSLLLCLSPDCLSFYASLRCFPSVSLP